MHMLSAILSSKAMSGFSAATARATRSQRPSVNFMMFALWTAVIFWRPIFRA